MAKRKTITQKAVVSVEIEYSVSIDEEKLDKTEERLHEDYAISLAITPDFNNEVLGVRLNSVNVISDDNRFYADFHSKDLACWHVME